MSRAERRLAAQLKREEISNKIWNTLQNAIKNGNNWSNSIIITNNYINFDLINQYKSEPHLVMHAVCLFQNELNDKMNVILKEIKEKKNAIH